MIELVCPVCSQVFDSVTCSSICPHNAISQHVAVSALGSRPTPMQQAVLTGARIHELVMEVLLEWGQAVNELQACKDESKKPEAEARARACGAEVQRLAMGLADKLRPNRS